MLGAVSVDRICRSLQDRCEDGPAVLGTLLTELDAAAARTVVELRGYLAGSATT